MSASVCVCAGNADSSYVTAILLVLLLLMMMRILLICSHLIFLSTTVVRSHYAKVRYDNTAMTRRRKRKRRPSMRNLNTDHVAATCRL